MSNLLYLIIAVALSLIGSLILWLRTRQPRSLESGIQQFSKGLRALAPEDDERGRDHPGHSGRERRTEERRTG
jgi:hypothetical protein